MRCGGSCARTEQEQKEPHAEQDRDEGPGDSWPGVGLTFIGISFTIYVLNGQQMNEILAWLFALGVFLIGRVLFAGLAAHFWLDDETVAIQLSGNISRRNRRNCRAGKRS